MFRPSLPHYVSQLQGESGGSGRILGTGDTLQCAPGELLPALLSCGTGLRALLYIFGWSLLCYWNPDTSLYLEPKAGGTSCTPGAAELSATGRIQGAPVCGIFRKSARPDSCAWERNRHQAPHAFMFCFDTLTKWIKYN